MNLHQDSNELENAFRIIIDTNKPFTSIGLRLFELFELSFVLFWSNGDWKYQHIYLALWEEVHKPFPFQNS